MAKITIESALEPDEFQPLPVAAETLDRFDGVAEEVGGAFASPPQWLDGAV